MSAAAVACPHCGGALRLVVDRSRSAAAAGVVVVQG